MLNPLFILAPQADRKAINLLLLHLRDWQFGTRGGDGDDGIKLVGGRDPASRSLLAVKSPRGLVVPTSPPIVEDSSNVWQGTSIHDVEVFCLRIESEWTLVEAQSYYEFRRFLVLDAQGLQEKTIVLGDRAIRYGDLEAEAKAEETGETEQDDLSKTITLDKFHKIRVPWHHAWLILANRNVANMDFIDFTNEEVGADEDGWWKYMASCEEDVFLSEENRKRRDDAIEEMRKLGHV